MIRRVPIILLEIVGAVAAAVLILAGGVAWRLSSGPVTLDFLSPYITAALSPENGAFRVEVEETLLTWGGWQRNLDIQARGVQAIRADGSLLARVPALSLELSLRALTRGMIAPISLDILGPAVRVSLAADGTIGLGVGDGSAAAGGPRGMAPAEQLPAALRDLLTTPDPNRPLGYLSRIGVVDATLVVADGRRNVVWRAYLSRLAIERDIVGIRGEARLELSDGKGRRVDLDLTGLYDAVRDTVDGSVAFRGLDPRMVAEAEPRLARLAAIEMMVDGKVDASFDDSGGVELAGFELSGGPGRILLPELYPDGLAVSLIQARGRLSGGLDRVMLDNLLIDLGGPTAVIAGELDGRGETPVFRADMVLRDMPADDLERYWPAGLGVGARRWMLANMHDGTYREVTATIAGKLPGGSYADPAIDSLSGDVLYDGMTVGYIEGMPPVLDVGGSASFDLDDVEVVIERGRHAGLKITGGTVRMADLTADTQYADIELQIRGPLRDALELIDLQPLGYAQKLGADPAALAGDSAVNLRLRVPLIADIPIEAIGIGAGVRLRDMSWRKAVLGLDVTDGALTIQLDKDGMLVAGDVAISGIPVAIKWREFFDRDAPLTSRVEAGGVLDDRGRALFGLDTGPLLEGPVGTRLVITDPGTGIDRIEADLDLTGAHLSLEDLGWEKAPAVPAKARLVLTLAQGRLDGIESFAINGGGLVAAGRGRFDGKGGLRRLEFDRIAFGLNELAGSVEAAPDGGYRLDIKGRSLDARPFLAEEDRDESPATAAGAPVDPGAAPPKETEHALPPLDVIVAVDRVWLGLGRRLDKVSGRLDRGANDWRSIRIEAQLKPEKALRISYLPHDAGRELLIFADDAGEALHSFGLLDDVIGGTLQLTATTPTTAPDSPLKGRLFMENYRVVRTPVLSRLLTLASLSGIVDTLSGEGIAFDSFEAPFTMKGGVIEVEKAQSRGSEIGLTLSGLLDTNTDMVEFEGLIVPAYSINSILGGIPVLGDLLVGEKGGGIFAFTYKVSGTLDDPDISVNPLSALTPGFLRGLFDIFGGGAPGSATDGTGSLPPETRDSDR